MASVAVYPATMAMNSYVAPTSDSLFAPTTTNVYECTLPDAGKVGLLVTYLAASSISSVRVKITPPSSTDGAFGYGVGHATPSQGSSYMTLFTQDFPIAASSYSRTFMGPFESARYGALSTVTALSGKRVLKLNFDCSTGHGSTSISSTSATLATVATTCWVMAFQLP
jgi:hypothetical protein